MYIKRICFPVKALGPGNRVGIWTTGCNRFCDGCMSTDLQRMESGKSVPVKEIMRILGRIEGDIAGVTISGGEPFLQPCELLELVQEIRNQITEDIIVYTGYTIDELREQNDPNINMILQEISVLIDGPYIDELNDGQGIRGSSNQSIHILRECASYQDLDTCKRNLQSFRYGGKILMIGVQ